VSIRPYCCCCYYYYYYYYYYYSEVSILLWQFAGDYFLKDADAGGVLAFNDFRMWGEFIEHVERIHGYVELAQLCQTDTHTHTHTHTDTHTQPSVILITNTYTQCWASYFKK